MSLLHGEKVADGVVQTQNWGYTRVAAAATEVNTSVDSDVDDLEEETPEEAVEPRAEASAATRQPVRALLSQAYFSHQSYTDVMSP